MTKFYSLCLVLGIFTIIGCVEQASETLPQAEAPDVIELSDEEMDLLHTSVDSIQVDLGEINAENYEEALEKLEATVDSE
ncbi:MAG: hypothetical protein KTR29_02880 [Rhodothermaceae bacterium]|nr:hypothetical protein [Rhodothermaceae bacterium]